jgi:hypothetical protein
LGVSCRGLFNLLFKFCTALRFFSESGWLSKCSVLANLNRKPFAAAAQLESVCAGEGGEEELRSIFFDETVQQHRRRKRRRLRRRKRRRRRKRWWWRRQRFLESRGGLCACEGDAEGGGEEEASCGLRVTRTRFNYRKSKVAAANRSAPKDATGEPGCDCVNHSTKVYCGAELLATQIAALCPTRGQRGGAAAKMIHCHHVPHTLNLEAGNAPDDNFNWMHEKHHELEQMWFRAGLCQCNMLAPYCKECRLSPYDLGSPTWPTKIVSDRRTPSAEERSKGDCADCEKDRRGSGGDRPRSR